MLLSRARAAEQKQLAANELNRADKAEEEVSCPARARGVVSAELTDAAESTAQAGLTSPTNRASRAD